MVGSHGAGAMLHVARDAQLPVLDHFKVKLWSKGRLGQCDAQEKVVLNCRYMLLLFRIFWGDDDKTCFRVCPSSVRLPLACLLG